MRVESEYRKGLEFEFNPRLQARVSVRSGTDRIGFQSFCQALTGSAF